jgi:lactoylglutathione lyase
VISRRRLACCAPSGFRWVRSTTLALATAIDHPLPGQVVVGIKTDDVDAAARAIEENGGGIVKGPYNDAHERRAVVYDNKGNGLVFYKSLPR